MKDFKVGVDLSVWNGENNFEIARENLDFVILRSSYGYDGGIFINSGVDERFFENYENARRAGICIGVYHYSYARNVNEAKLEAKKVLDVLHKRHLDLPIFYDVEDDVLFSYDDNITDRIIAFTEIIQSAGYRAGFYTNLYFMGNYIDVDRLKNRNLTKWIAYYNEDLFEENPSYFKGSYHIWQYTSAGKLDGISNYGDGIDRVDMNIMYDDFCNNKKEFFSDIEEEDRFYLIPENAHFELMVDKIFVREKPSRKSKKITYYSRGETVAYDYYTINDGHVWISYIGMSGNRRYMAIGEHNGINRTSVWGRLY